MMVPDTRFFWPHHGTLEQCANSIEYFCDEAMGRGDDNFTEEERVMLLLEARKVQEAGAEMVKRLTLAGKISYPSGTRVVRFRRKRDGTIVRPDGTEVCPKCGELISPGSMGLHRQQLRCRA